MNKRFNLNIIFVFSLFLILFSSCSFNKEIKHDDEKKYTTITIVPNFDKVMEDAANPSSARYLGIPKEEIIEQIKKCTFRISKENSYWDSEVLKEWSSYQEFKKDPKIENILLGKINLRLEVINSNNKVIFSAEDEFQIVENPEPIVFLLEQITDNESNIRISVYDYLGINEDTEDEFNGVYLYFYQLNKETGAKEFVGTYIGTSVGEYASAEENYFAFQDNDEYYLVADLDYAIKEIKKYNISINCNVGEYWVEGYLVHFFEESFPTFDEDTKTPIFAEQYILSPFGLEKDYYAGSYKLTFNLNGGEFTEELSDLDKLYFKDNAKKLKVPQKENYIFGGWYSDEELTKSVCSEETYFYFNTDGNVTGDKTLYAQWLPKITYTYYVDNKLYRTESVAKNRYKELAYLNYDEIYLYTGSYDYEFIGWFENEDCTGDVISEISAEENTKDRAFYGIICNNFDDDGSCKEIGYVPVDYYLSRIEIPLNEILQLPENKEFILNDELTYKLKIYSNSDVTDVTTAVKFTAPYSKYLLYGKSLENPEENASITLYKNSISEIEAKIVFNRDYGNDPENTSIIENYQDARIVIMIPKNDDTEYGRNDYYINFEVEEINVKCAPSFYFGINSGGESIVKAINLQKDDDGNRYLPKYGVIDNDGNGKEIYGFKYFEDGSDTFFTFDGMKFVGWYDNPEYTGEPIEYLTEEGDDISVYYAKWAINPTLNEWTEDGQTYSNYQASIPFIQLFPDFNYNDGLEEGKYLYIKINATPNFDYKPIQVGQFGISIADKSDGGWSAYAQKMIQAGENNIELINGVPFEYIMNIPIAKECSSWNLQESGYFEIVFSNTDLQADGETPNQLISSEMEPLLLTDWKISISQYEQKLNSNYLIWDKEKSNEEYKYKVAITNYFPINPNTSENYVTNTLQGTTRFISDSKNNIYTLNYTNNNGSISKNNKVFFSATQNLNNIYIDEDNNSFYAAEFIYSENIIKFYKWNINELNNSPEEYILSVNDIPEFKGLSKFAVYNDYILCCFNSNNIPLFACYEYKDGEFVHCGEFLDYEQFADDNLLLDTFEINDMKVIENDSVPTLYVLFGKYSCEIIDKIDRTIKLFSKGFISSIALEINENNFSWSWNNDISGLGTGYSTNQNLFTKVGAYQNKLKIEYYGLTEDEIDSCFVNPQQIIGINDRKELLILDDGIFVGGEKVPGSEDEGYFEISGIPYSVNRIVTVNLEEKTFSSEYLPLEFTNIQEIGDLDISQFESFEKYLKY